MGKAYTTQISKTGIPQVVLKISTLFAVSKSGENLRMIGEI